jgi:hypothetical protein
LGVGKGCDTQTADADRYADDIWYEESWIRLAAGEAIS